MSPNLLDLVIWPYLSFIRTCKSKLRGPNMAGVKPNQTWKGINRRPNTQVNIPTRLLQHRIQCECWGSLWRDTLLDHQRMMSYLIWVDHRAGDDIRGSVWILSGWGRLAPGMDRGTDAEPPRQRRSSNGHRCSTRFRINTRCLSHVCHHVSHVIRNPTHSQKGWKINTFAQIHKKVVKV